MESISNSFAPAPNHRTFGRGARASGGGEACGERCRCHWIGRSMSPMKRRAPLQPGPARDCPPKPSFIGQHMGQSDGEEERFYPWGDDQPDSRRGNFGGNRWDPVPVTATPLGDSAFGISQLVGNGWEWTSTVFQPFPGFQAPFVLSRILSTLLRWRPLCAQRGVFADRRRFAAPIISQLVPAQLPLCLCRISLCGGLT